MKTFKIITICVGLFSVPLVGNADDEKPPTNMIEHRRWAFETKDLQLRIQRLEGFMSGYLPSEDGGTNPDMRGYGDGSHALAVAGCAWQLTRAYMVAGKKDEAMKMLDWLQQHDSKSMLLPIKEEANKSEQATPRKPSD